MTDPLSQNAFSMLFSNSQPIEPTDPGKLEDVLNHGGTLDGESFDPPKTNSTSNFSAGKNGEYSGAAVTLPGAHGAGQQTHIVVTSTDDPTSKVQDPWLDSPRIEKL